MRALVVLAALGAAATVYWAWRGDSRPANDAGLASPSSVRAPVVGNDAPARPAASTASTGAAASREADEPPAQNEAPPSADAPEQALRDLVGGVDPLLVERNLIVPNRGSQREGPSFEDVELRFRAEQADAAWSKPMEARILGEVAGVTGLGLAGLEAECRATVCRLKLFHPPGTNALSSLDKLRPIATEIGFDSVVEVATLGEEGVPISLIYFQRDAA